MLDTVGGEVTNKSFAVLRQGGILVSMLGQPNQELAVKYGVTSIGQATKNTAVNLKRVAELVDEGKMKVHIDKVFPFEVVRQAFNHFQSGHIRGKVVLKIKG